MTISKDQIAEIEKFEDILNRNYIADARRVTEVYNTVFDKHLSVSNCSSCIRNRVTELVRAKNQVLAQLAEAEKKAEEEAKQKEEEAPKKPKKKTTKK